MTQIYETAVHDRSTLRWRILNLDSGNLYPASYSSELVALDAITKGGGQAGGTVCEVRRADPPRLLRLQAGEAQPPGQASEAQVLDEGLTLDIDIDELMARRDAAVEARKSGHSLALGQFDHFS